jgi:hypothetical protein
MKREMKLENENGKEGMKKKKREDGRIESFRDRVVV